MIIGGIAFKSKRDHDVSKALKGLKGDGFAETEVKWEKTKKGERLKLHKDVVDYTFEQVDSGQFHFHSLIVPFSDFDHGLRGDKGKSNSVTRMYYQLSLHRPVRYYGEHCAIHIKPDKSDDYLGFGGYIDALNNDAKKKYGIKTRPVREITFPCSKLSAIHQMNDLIIGALAHTKNERHLVDGASGHKCDLAEYVHQKIKGLKNKKNFTIWNFNSPLLKTTKPPA